MAIKMIIFDLDGTLVDTIEGIGFSMNKVLENHGFPIHSMEAYRGFVGHGIRQLVADTLPKEYRNEQNIQICYQEMLQVYSESYSKGICLYPGIEDLLNELVKRDYKLGINTNKNQKITNSIVKELLNKWQFTKVIGDEGGYPKKPDPAAALAITFQEGINPSECIYIGDSEVDYRTAKNAGMKAVLVLWGFRSKEELLKLEPEIMIGEPKEIFQYI